MVTEATVLAQRGIVLVRTTRAATADGLVELEDDVPVGLEYRIDLGTVRTVELFHLARGVRHRKAIVNTVDEHGRFTGWMPLEFFCHG